MAKYLRDRDHPRSRGVYTFMIPRSVSASGSSPLARGLLRVLRPPLGRIGIIPARAGFTCQRLQATRSFRDHPRSRGVYRRCRSVRMSRLGSSPLARGLHNWDEYLLMSARIIPARAGFTRGLSPGRRVSRDHPRSRGVSPLGELKRGALEGSSPLARGLLGRLVSHRYRPRIIPARAGFTWRPVQPGY